MISIGSRSAALLVAALVAMRPAAAAESTPALAEEAETLPAEGPDEPAETSATDLDALFGPSRYFVEEIEIRGNLRTNTSLIRRALAVRPGAVLDESAVLESRLRVLGLGLFREVDMRLERGSSPGRVRLVVEVEERNSLVISDLFLGFTDVSLPYGGFGLADANLLGTGLVGNGAVIAGRDGRRAYRVSLHDPNFLGRDVVVGAAATWIQGVEVRCPLGLGECGPAGLDRLRYRRSGGIVSAGIRSGRHSRVFGHLRVEDVRADVEPGLITGTDRPFTLDSLELPFIRPSHSTLSTVAISFEHDTRNDPFFATRGTRAVVSVEVGSELFWSSYEYARYYVSLGHHLPGFRDHALRIGLFGGFVQGEAPFFDRFHVADHSYFTVGANTVPRALELSFTEVSQYDDVLLSGDLRYLIPVFSGGDFVYRGALYFAAAVTLSARSVESSLLDLSFDPKNEISRFPFSADAGLRIDTNIGVFSIGVSWPLDMLF